MRKMCATCGVPFELSGSGRRQKCCPKCAVRVTGQGRVSQPSNALKTKGAETPFEEALDRPAELVARPRRTDCLIRFRWGALEAVAWAEAQGDESQRGETLAAYREGG